MDLQGLSEILSGKATKEDEKSGCGDVVIRQRWIIKYVTKKHALAYVLSLAQKHSYTLKKEAFSFLSYYEPILRCLKESINATGDSVEFAHVQKVAFECLTRAVSHYLSQINSNLLYPHTFKSIGLGFDLSSIINRRRRQEDRWFATADVLTYVPSNLMKSCDYSPVCAFGVFDGHNGPEIAEHCSHMSPYYLSLELQRRISGADASKSIPDILAKVFHRLNMSANESRKKQHWNSGTTVTICVLTGSTICTAWVGDSQAWLVYKDGRTSPLSDHRKRTHEHLSKHPPSPTSPTSGSTKLDHSPKPNSSSPTSSISPTPPGHYHRQSGSLPTLPESPTRLDTKESTVKCNGFQKASSEQPDSKPNDSSISMNSKQQQQQQKQEQDVRSPKGFSNGTNKPMQVALTDCIHRPEFAPEFVSVLRTGGSVSVEVTSENGSTVGKQIYYARSPRNSLAAFISQDNSSRSCKVALPTLNPTQVTDCRVGCVSSVSRSIGDDDIAGGINALPSITTWSMTAETPAPLCLIIASDGLWDTPGCSGPEVASIARTWFREKSSSSTDQEHLSDHLTRLAAKNGASDNITSLVLWLDQWKPTTLTGWEYTHPSSALMRWPRNSRVASEININSKPELKVRGPRDGISQNFQSPSRPRSVHINMHIDRKIKFSSPPRHVC